MTVSGAMRMLLLTEDSSLIAAFAGVSRELGIEAEFTGNSQLVSNQLNRAKYEGVLLDFDTVNGAHPILASIRESRSNKNIVVFALATDHMRFAQAILDRAHFLLRRPIEKNLIRDALNTAYDLMLGERRLHFRCTAELSAKITVISSGKLVECATINVSGNGLTVKSPVSFQPAETVDISFVLPDGFTVRAMGIVIWDDQHGKSGLHFQCSRPEMRHKLDSWLNSQVANERTSPAQYSTNIALRIEQGSLHQEIQWNGATKQWLCLRCLRSSGHSTRTDAERELSQFPCIALV
jgi:PilZ domain